MEQRAYQKWTRGLLLGLVLVLTACAAVVYRVDPCFYYRMPTDREPVFFSERYQTAGIVRNNPADVVLLGSSMTANCYGSQLETVFGGTGGIYPAGHRAGADAPGRPAGGRRQKSGGCGKLGGAVPGGGI